MKNFMATLFVLGAIFFPVRAESEVIAGQQHGDWDSYTILLDKTAFARMATGTGGRAGSMLAIDRYPGDCENPLIQIVIFDVPKGQEYRETTTGSVRVDKRSVFDVEYFVMAEEAGIFIYPASQSMPTIFKDLMAGAVVRFKINPIPDAKAPEPVYKRYSLSGFTAADQRTLKMCQEIQEIQADVQQKNNPDFFNENSMPRITPDPDIKTKESDPDYFI